MPPGKVHNRAKDMFFEEGLAEAVTSLPMAAR